MKKRITLALLVILITSMILGTTSAFAELINARKFNVVFVVDASNSMNATDSQGWRFEAIDQFLSLLSMQGNYVGTVVFNGEIVNASEVSAISSKSDKKAASDAVRSATPIGYTNIGEALAKANELLKNGDENLPSIILLLSDGNTEMPPDPPGQLERSLNAQMDAISTAKNNDTRIFCVGLNANGKMKQNELANIANQTNGTFKIVSKADDLKEVFQEFYKLIYGTGGTTIENVELPAIKEFVVPKIGVEEVNILIDGQPSSITLTQPSGMIVSDSELSSMSTRGMHFTNIKIEKPLSGTWKIELIGEPGQTVTINFIPNLNVSLITEETQPGPHKRNETVSFITKIVSEGNDVTDNSVYQEYPAILTITKANKTDESETINAVAIDGKYKSEYSFTESGTYYVTASIDIGYGQITGNTIPVSIDNVVPKAKKEQFEFSNFALGFGKKEFRYNLNDLVFDEDGEKLSFSMDKFSLSEEQFAIDENDGVLSVKPESECTCDFRIIATDESGASCEFGITITFKNLLKFILQILALVLVLGGLVFVILRHIATHKRFNGSITVTAFDTENGEKCTPETVWPANKPQDIQKISSNAYGVGGIKGTFYGTGKDFVKFVPKGNAFHYGKKIKRLEISNGAYETITSNQDETRGIEVTFSKS